MNISLSAENLYYFGPIAFTNGMASGLLILALAMLSAIVIPRTFAVVPGRIQLVLEMLSEYVLGQLESAFGSKAQAKRFFPMLFTLLLFLVVANQLTAVPLIGQITLGEKSLFRLTTSDLNETFALALLMVGVSHVLAFKISPLGHIGNFIRIKPLLSARSVGQLASAMLGFALGLLDIVGELAKVLSLSFRIFGNIFAGEVMVVVIASISAYTYYIVPIPFIFLSLFSGFVQAFVFFMLSLQFIAATVRSQQEPESEGHSRKEDAEQYNPTISLNVATVPVTEMEGVRRH